MREGRFAELDLARLADEIDASGTSEYKAFESALVRLLQHLLKWDFQPERRGRSWALTVRTQRLQVGRALKRSPSLGARRFEIMIDAYALAQVRDAARNRPAGLGHPRVQPLLLRQCLDLPYRLARALSIAPRLVPEARGQVRQDILEASRPDSRGGRSDGHRPLTPALRTGTRSRCRADVPRAGATDSVLHAFAFGTPGFHRKFADRDCAGTTASPPRAAART